MNEHFLAADGEIPDFDFIHESPVAGVAGSHLLNITKEREIFLRAALQLLDHREHQTAPKKHSNKRNVNDSNEEDMADVIRCGSIRKLHRYSSISITWKKKFAELRHGLFSYENESKKWFSKSGRTSNRKKKAIVLSSQFCKCKPVLWKGIYARCVFEITTTGQSSSRRLWLASSTEERDAWISAINCATVGSAGDFIGITGPDGSALSVPSPHHSGHWMNNGSLFSHLPGTLSHMDEEEIGDNGGALMTALRQAQMRKPPFFGQASTPDRLYNRSPEHATTNPTEMASVTVVSGPNAMSSLPITTRYAQSIAKYMDIQKCVAECVAPTDYQSLLWKLIEHAKIQHTQEGIGSVSALDKPHILVVPIDFVKKQSQGTCFMRSPTDGLTTDHTALKSVTSSQVWKDLQRDSIRINGQLISGESQGPEGMLGALVRHILAKVDDIREILQKHDRPLGHVSNEHLFQEKGKKRASVLNNRTSGCAGVGSQHFAIDESQVLACVRDMLVLCNRTQSGGDTYFCVDSLICNREYAIVTPSVMESEPLEITVDIVEGTSSNQTYPHTHLSIDLERRMSVNLDNHENDPHENDPLTDAESDVPVRSVGESTDSSTTKSSPNEDATGAATTHSLRFPELDDSVPIEDGLMVSGGVGLDVIRECDEEETEDILDHGKPSKIASSPSTKGTKYTIADQEILVVDGAVQTTGSEGAAGLSASVTSGEESGVDVDIEPPCNLSDKSRTSMKQPRTPSTKAAKSSEISYNGGNMCIRVQIKAKSNYRLCNLDPQDEDTDTWATIEGQFEQAFYIKTSCNGRPAISDRLVSVSMQLPNHMATP